MAPSSCFQVKVGGVPKAVCCAGCEAVAATILGLGLGEYYRLRSELSPAPSTPNGGDDDLTVYDDPAVQKGFVRSTRGESAALLLLEDIRCGACVWLCEKVIAKLPGVTGVEINFATHRASVRWNPADVRLSDILCAVRAIGYRAHPYEPGRVDLVRQEERRRALWRIFVAGFGMMQVMMYAVPAYFADAGEISADIEQLLRWAGLLLTLPVILYSAMPFFGGAARDLRQRRLGMDVPMSLGIAIAFGASVYATVSGSGAVYFDSVAMLVFVVLAGRYLELLARQRAARTLEHLGRIVPEFAERLPAGSEDSPIGSGTERVSAAELMPGDLVLVRAGHTVPADGVVVQGSSSINEALLTGEANPSARSPGKEIVAGAINISHPLVIRVTRVGKDTVLSAIERLIERAAGERPKAAVLAERAAGVFILCVLAIALAAGTVWAAIDPAKAIWVTISVLVATCPCAFSLAAPVALTASTGALARRGLVVTQAAAIETLSRATDIVFDKTGTLTHGRLQLSALDPLEKQRRADCLALAASLESASEHPVAAAVMAAARAEGITAAAVDRWNNFPGEGVEATVKDERYRIGAAHFVREISDGGKSSRGSESGEVLLGSEHGVLAELRFGDTLRPDAAHAAEELRGLGLELHLLTGDSERFAGEVARKLDIGRVCARARPREKRAYVRNLQKNGAIVAMIGDGINDAPVLAQADVSVAMGGGASLAQLQGDAVLMSGNPGDLAWAVAHARRTFAIVRQNITWAFGYNLVVLPLAIAGTVSPLVAAIGMSTSSLLVVLNALRLAAGKSTNPRPAYRFSGAG